MKPTDFLLSLIDACGGLQGRTLLQKSAYFAAILSGVSANLGFDAHYYGPYSSVVDGTITQLKNLGFLQESSTGFGAGSGGFEMRRYDYSLTEDGKKIVENLRHSEDYKRIQTSVQKIQAAGNPNYVELSIAAKAFFILKKKGKPMTSVEIAKEAERFNWEVSPQAIERAVSFLRQVELTTAK